LRAQRTDGDPHATQDPVAAVALTPAPAMADTARGAGPGRTRGLDAAADWMTSPLAVALTMGVLIYSQLETMSARPNFVKVLAYATGDADMQFKLGAFYYKGLEGLGQDHAKARAWFESAAEQGHDQAALHLGYMHYKGEAGGGHGRRDGTNASSGSTRHDAHRWMAVAAKQNNTEAAYRLGYLYYSGEGVQRNYQLAARQFRAAAERKHAGAAAMLGAWAAEEADCTSRTVRTCALRGASCTAPPPQGSCITRGAACPSTTSWPSCGSGARQRWATPRPCSTSA
jgi:TPR repeat protein